LTCDWFLEGTHFLRKTHPPEAVGWKCLARAVSDLAAMGAEPRCFLLSLALPESCRDEWLDKFLHGLRKAAVSLGCLLAGGDTTRWNEVIINITVVGDVKREAAALRSGARPGDRIFVSGRLGEAELGLRLLRRDKKLGASHRDLLRKHLYPEPRIWLGRWLVKNRIATAMIDLSDGLSSDLARLCEASRAGATIHSGKLPLSSEKFSGKFSEQERLAAAIHGGDDYELLFTVPPSRLKAVSPNAPGGTVTEIGVITSARNLEIVDQDGRTTALQALGWDPFQR
jgi:thiamine-monophosphate kinase